MKRNLLVLFITLTTVLFSFAPVYASAQTSGQTAFAGYDVSNNPKIANLYQKFALPDPGSYAAFGSAFCMVERMYTQDLPSHGSAIYTVTAKFCAPTTHFAEYTAYVNVTRNGVTQLARKSSSASIMFPTNDQAIMSMNYQPGVLSFNFYDLTSPGYQYSVNYRGYKGNGYYVSTTDAEVGVSLNDATPGNCDNLLWDAPDVIISATGQTDKEYGIQSPDWNYGAVYTSERGNPSVILLQPTALNTYKANGVWQGAYGIAAPGAC